MNQRFNPLLSSIIFISFFLVFSFGCGGGGGGGGDSEQPPAVQSGVFIDSHVDGLWYETKTQEGFTDNGTFKYYQGETVAFYIGNLFIGEGAARSKMSPIDLVSGAANETDDTVTNISRLLQSLDYDGNPGNGILITPEIAELVDNYQLEFDESINSFASSGDMGSLFSSLNNQNLYMAGVTGSLVSAAQAQAHLNASMNDVPDGVVKTATGTYNYNSSTNLLTINYAGSTFTGCGPSTSRPDQFEILAISSTQMVWDQDDGPMVWTRTSGTGTGLVGTWTFYDTDNGNTYTVDVGDDNSVLVIGYMVYCDEGGTAEGTYTIPFADITIDGSQADWNQLDPVFTDSINDQDPDADLDGTDLHKFYLAKDDTFLYMAITLYDGDPKTDLHTQYGFEAQTLLDQDSTGDHLAKAGYQNGAWYSAVYIRDHADIAKYPSNYVGTGPGFLEWKVRLSDMWELNGRYIRVYIHTFEGAAWYDVSDSDDVSLIISD